MDTVALLVDNEQLQKKVKELELDKARLREAIEDALPTLKSEEKHSSLITRTLQEAIASTDSSNWLAEQKAQWRREVAEGFQEAFSDAMQSDFENGVKWLNEECVKEFKQKYPEIWDTIGMIARMAELASTDSSNCKQTDNKNDV